MMAAILHDISLFLIPLGIVYAAYILFYYRGLSKLSGGSNTELYSVTVIIPARNEEKNIARCLDALLLQDYPKEKYSLIVVDDCSTDSTRTIVEKYSHAYSDRVALIAVDERDSSISPKINALNLGINASQGEIIATTDADCFVSNNWISSIIAHFEKNIGVITGLTVYEPSASNFTLFEGIQFLDFISYSSVGAGTIGTGTVSTCNGSNMAFRRKAFEEIHGFNSFAHLNTGDDSLLAQKIIQTEKWKIKFIINPFSRVSTFAVKTWRDFFHQRMRWSGQTTEYPIGVLMFMINTFIMFVLLLVTVPATVFYWTSIPWIVLAVKFIIDYLMMKNFCRMTQTEKALRYFIPTAIIHIPVIVFSVFGGFFGQFTWKERTVGRRAE